MINRYRKGANFERKVVKILLENEGCVIAFRSAGSHSPIDVVGIEKDKIILIQCKIGGVISKKDIKVLKDIQKIIHINKVNIYIVSSNKLLKNGLNFYKVKK